MFFSGWRSENSSNPYRGAGGQHRPGRSILVPKNKFRFAISLLVEIRTLPKFAALETLYLRRIRLEDAREVLLDLDDTVDFKHGSYKQSVATVGDQVRKVFEAIVTEPMLTSANQYVRLKL